MNLKELGALSTSERADELGRRWAGMRDQMRAEGLDQIHGIMYYMRSPNVELLAQILDVSVEEAEAKAQRVGEILLEWMPDDIFNVLIGQR